MGKVLSFKHDLTVTLRNSQQLWLPTVQSQGSNPSLRNPPLVALADLELSMQTRVSLNLEICFPLDSRELGSKACGTTPGDFFSCGASKYLLNVLEIFPKVPSSFSTLKKQLSMYFPSPQFRRSSLEFHIIQSSQFDSLFPASSSSIYYLKCIHPYCLMSLKFILQGVVILWVGFNNSPTGRCLLSFQTSDIMNEPACRVSNMLLEAYVSIILE